MNYSHQLTCDQIKLTAPAREKMSELLNDNEEAKAIRLFVLGGGCNGMSYSMSFSSETYETDSTYQENSVTLYLDPIASHYLKGVEIDYSENEMGASFLFNNVFQIIGGTGGCSGCGSSQ